MWDTLMGNQGGQSLASYVRTNILGYTLSRMMWWMFGKQPCPFLFQFSNEISQEEKKETLSITFTFKNLLVWSWHTII